MDIFVGSLPFKIKESELKELFQKFGEVSSVTIIINKATRQNKGFGFVVMPSEGEALEAINHLNGTEVMGRVISVTQSTEKKSSSKTEANPNKTKRPIVKNSFSWKKKPTKKDENIITFGDNEKEPGFKKEIPRAKAKNFKVGARKKK